MPVPSVSFERPAITENHDEGTLLLLSVVLSEPSASDVMVALGNAWLSTRGDDVTILDPQVTIAAGETRGTVRVRIEADSLFEDEEMVKLEITSATGATIDQGDHPDVGDVGEYFFFINISDRPTGPAVGFQRPTDAYSRFQEGTVVDMVLTLSEAATETVTVTLTNSFAPLRPNEIELLDETVVFAPGETSAVAQVRILEDFTAEASELMMIAVTSVTGANAYADITGHEAGGQNDEYPFFIAANTDPSEVFVGFERPDFAQDYREGSVVDMPVVLSQASASTITVNLEIMFGDINASDLMLLDPVLEFAPGETRAVAQVRVEDDMRAELYELMRIAITSATGATIDTAAHPNGGNNSQFWFTVDENDESFFGHFTDDVLVGDINDNLMSGNGGDDHLTGHGGRDRMNGGEGNDTLLGGDGDDNLQGYHGHDLLEGGRGTDTLNGGDGDDTIIGGDTSDDLRDVVYAGNGNDSVDGGHGNDSLRGDDGHDTIEGGFGVDTVIGGAGNDVLTGSALSDLIFGNDGDDFINGGFGFDRVNGGSGADRFFHVGIRDHGADWIQDYNADDGDRLFYGGGAGPATADDFLIQSANTAGAGSAGVDEIFVTHIPTGTLLWALVDGGDQSAINIQIGGQVFDLLA